MSIYDIGDVTRVHFDFADINDAPVDPSTIVVTVTLPTPPGGTVTYSGAGVVNDPDAVGRWYVDHEFTVAGTHHFRAVATGNLKAAVSIDVVCRA